MPHVQYYNVGANEWRSAEKWPLPETEYRKFFLTSGGKANSRYGDGRLDASWDQDSAASDTYIYDPSTPYTTISALTDTDTHVMQGAFNRSEMENRNDVLIYTSDVLENAVNVTGPMKAVLY